MKTQLNFRVEQQVREELEKELNEFNEFTGAAVSLSHYCRKIIEKHVKEKKEEKMKNIPKLVSVLLLTLFLSACGKTVTLPSFDVPKDQIPASKAEPTPSPKPTIVDCEGSISVMNLNKVSYGVTFNLDGSSIVSCSVTNINGVTVNGQIEYDPEHPDFDYGIQQAGVCKVYYNKNGYAQWVIFIIPGYADSAKPLRNPINDGWQISNSSNIPGVGPDGLSYNKSTCRKVQ